ncbi:MAG: cytochrome C [Bacillota bacterium]|nr:cytochrome C [Bacillota bacterium]
MNKAILSFVLSVIIGVGLGYLIYAASGGPGDTPPEEAAATAPASSGTQATASAGSTQTSSTAVDQNNILSQRGCLGCHSVSALGIHAGQVGPDLSQAFNEVQNKHGIPIEQFLTKPNSAVMSGVLGSKPLTDDQRKQVLALLKKASEVKQAN